jgi:hypothetical protein
LVRLHIKAETSRRASVNWKLEPSGDSGAE